MWTCPNCLTDFNYTFRRPLARLSCPACRKVCAVETVAAKLLKLKVGPRLPPEQRQAVCDGCLHWDADERACKGLCGSCPSGKADIQRILTDPNSGCPIGRHSRPRFITTKQRVDATYRMAARLPHDLAAIIGVSRSGVAPAGLIAELLHVPLWIMADGKVHRNGGGWRAPEIGNGPVLVVDDTLATGRSLKAVREIASAALTGRKIFYAVIYRNPAIPIAKTLDFWAEDLPGSHLLEWNLFNSVYSPEIALDFDGIVCHDAASGGELLAPYYLPRKCPVPLIVTGRNERHRAATLAWLAKWGIKCDRLEMLPDNQNHDEPGVSSRHKAKHYAASGLSLFVESCSIQAREIAGLTAKPVLCPAAGKVF